MLNFVTCYYLPLALSLANLVRFVGDLSLFWHPFLTGRLTSFSVHCNYPKIKENEQNDKL